MCDDTFLATKIMIMISVIEVLTYIFQRVFNTPNSFNLTSISSSQITYLDDSADD